MYLGKLGGTKLGSTICIGLVKVGSKASSNLITLKSLNFDTKQALQGVPNLEIQVGLD